MADTVETSTSESANVSGAVEQNSPKSGDSKQALSHLPSDPANKAAVDSGARSRHSRLQSIMKNLNEEDDEAEVKTQREYFSKNKTDNDPAAESRRTRAQEAVKEEPEEIAEEETESRAESRTGAKAADKKADDKSDAEKEEDRREARRKEVADKEEGEVAEEPAAEAKPEEPEDKEKVSKAEKERREKFEKVLAMEAKAQKQQEKLRQREELIMRREREFDTKLKEAQNQYQRQVEEHRRTVSMAEQVLKLARENPLELLERSGAKPEDVANWITNASDPTTQKLKEYDRRFEELAQRERNFQEQERVRQERERTAQLRSQVESEYLGHFEEKDDSGEPVLEAAKIIYSRNEILQLGHQLADEAAQAGHTFTSRDIAEAVNELAKDDERYKQIQKRLSNVSTAPKPSTAPVTEPKVAPAAKPAPSTSTSPKTTTILNNRTAQDTVPAPGPSKAPDANWKRARETRLKRLQAGLE